MAPSCMISAPAAQFCDHVAFAGSREPELNSRVGANGAVWDDGMKLSPKMGGGWWWVLHLEQGYSAHLSW